MRPGASRRPVLFLECVERVSAAVTIDAVLDLENRYGIATEILLI